MTALELELCKNIPADADITLTRDNSVGYPWWICKIGIHVKDDAHGACWLFEGEGAGIEQAIENALKDFRV